VCLHKSALRGLSPASDLQRSRRASPNMPTNCGSPVWVESLEAKDALLATDAGKFFTTSHYNGQPIVLVRLEAVEVDEARELVTESWRVRASRALTRGHGDGGQRP